MNGNLDGNSRWNCSFGFLHRDIVPVVVIQEGLAMVLKHFFTAAICATLLAWSGPSFADQYRPGEFLSLDLSKAVLSPKPLGPATQFAPFPVEAGIRSRRRGPAGARGNEAGSSRPCRPDRTGASGRKETAWRGVNQARAPPRQSAGRAGVRYADSGLAMPVRRHLQLVAAGVGALTQGRVASRHGRNASRCESSQVLSTKCCQPSVDLDSASGRAIQEAPAISSPP